MSIFVLNIDVFLAPVFLMMRTMSNPNVLMYFQVKGGFQGNIASFFSPKVINVNLIIELYLDTALVLI